MLPNIQMPSINFRKTACDQTTCKRLNWNNLINVHSQKCKTSELCQTSVQCALTQTSLQTHRHTHDPWAHANMSTHIITHKQKIRTHKNTHTQKYTDKKYVYYTKYAHTKIHTQKIHPQNTHKHTHTHTNWHHYALQYNKYTFYTQESCYEY